jgi:hypothetical protein
MIALGVIVGKIERIQQERQRNKKKREKEVNDSHEI